MNILVTDGMDASAVQSLRDAGFAVTEQFYAPEELGKALRDFDVAVVRSKTKVRANHIDEAKGSRLKLIIRGGVGVDNIDVAYAEANGIAVKNTPRASSESVAELAMAHMFSCARYISSPATPGGRASGRRRPTARASSSRARHWASWALAESARSCASWPRLWAWRSSPRISTTSPALRNSLA